MGQIEEFISETAMDLAEKLLSERGIVLQTELERSLVLLGIDCGAATMLDSLTKADLIKG